jgi:hypothetical protein
MCVVCVGGCMCVVCGVGGWVHVCGVCVSVGGKTVYVCL